MQIRKCKRGCLNILSLFLIVGGCSNCYNTPTSGDATESVQLDIHAESDSLEEIHGEVDVDVGTDDVAPVDPVNEEDPLPDAPNCGNGELDDGEECDDGNRLNGDGCNWICQLGDGSLPGEPNPSACRYSLTSGPVTLEDLSPVGVTIGPLPFVWTSSEFAAVFFESEPNTIQFRRFDGMGFRIGTDFTVSSPGIIISYDLVWNGTSFALFYVDDTQGIFLQRLAADGDTIAPPVLVVPDPLARMPTADNIDGGYILVWLTDGVDPTIPMALCSTNGPHTAKAQFILSDGSAIGTPVTFWDSAWGPPVVATGQEGFGVSVTDYIEEESSCYYRFLHLSDDLGEVTESGYLSRGLGFDVTWTGGYYATSWTHWWGPWDGELCVARFHRTGVLETAPVCSAFFGELHDVLPPRLEAGCNGLSIIYPGVYASDPPNILFTALVRTDEQGREIESPNDFTCCTQTNLAYNLVQIDRRTLAVLQTHRDPTTRVSSALLYIFMGGD